MTEAPRRVGAILAVLSFLVAQSASARAGEVRCWIDKGALIAPAAFGDSAGDFLIDLSAPASQLHVTRAQSAGVAEPMVARDLVIAGQTVGRFSMVVSDLDARTASFDTTVNGVIGADVLDRFTVDIEPSPCRLRLSRTAVRARVGETMLHARAALDGRPLVMATVTDGAQVRSGPFALDTAHWTTRLSRARPSTPSPDGVHRNPPRLRLRALEVGGRLFEQVPVVVAPDADAEVSGAIGMAVLSRLHMRLDARAGSLLLSRPQRKTRPPAEPGFTADD